MSRYKLVLPQIGKISFIFLTKYLLSRVKREWLKSTKKNRDNFRYPSNIRFCW